MRINLTPYTPGRGRALEILLGVVWGEGKQSIRLMVTLEMSESDYDCGMSL